GWGVHEGVSISEVGRNMFLFHFSDEEVVYRTKRDAPWNVMGYLLSLQPWYQDRPMDRVSFNRIPFWVQLHGLPLERFNFQFVAKIGKRLGHILIVENPYVQGRLLRSFYRIRFIMNISKPFPTGCLVPTVNQKDHVWVSFKYEK
ncbi:hypothetical protein SESBI_00925, partial [Sesbania bispinosa]